MVHLEHSLTAVHSGTLMARKALKWALIIDTQIGCSAALGVINILSSAKPWASHRRIAPKSGPLLKKLHLFASNTQVTLTVQKNAHQREIDR